jgi:hypothetical protein
MRILITQFLLFIFTSNAYSQTNVVTYAGNAGKETFYDVLELSDGTFLVCGYADNLDWIDQSVNKIQLSNVGGIPNGLGTNKFGIILHLSKNLQQLLDVVHFPQGAVEDVRFIKTNTQPYTTTGNLYISGNTSDTYNNDGGYFLARLNNNFVNGIPTALEWSTKVWAESGPKDYHPWDVTNDGRIFYISGQAHAYDWSAIYCLDANGQRMVVENWRTHWLKNGQEFKGTPASSNPNGGIDSVKYSGVVLKNWGRCDLRSWTSTDYNQWMSDGNGGTRKGKWPIDVLFSGPCDPQNPSSVSPGYTGYSATSCCPVYGGSSIVVDKRNNDLYIGMNMKSTASAEYGNSPDFEPAVIAMNVTGTLKWWSRLYHEVTPAGDTVESIPDQYIDALAIDYLNDKLVVNARMHGNNTENFWEGNTIAADQSAYGFQNRFTGTNGNIHESWLGKLTLADGVLTNSTYVAELAEGTGSLGTPHPDPNLDGWPDPNTGWPDVNTTRLAKNNMKVTSDGSVCVVGVGRRTITTANAYQKMVKPANGGLSCWNSFARVYDPQFHVPLYSSLIVGQWDTLTQAGGSNTEMFGIYKTTKGVICVGRQTADNSGLAIGNNIPVVNTPSWGAANPNNETAILVYYEADNLNNPNDGYTTIGVEENTDIKNKITLYPNPVNAVLTINTTNVKIVKLVVYDLLGQICLTKSNANTIDVSTLPAGIYSVQIVSDNLSVAKLFIKN